AVVAGRTPVGQEVFHLVRRLWLPQLVRLGHISGNDRVEEMFCRSLFGIETEDPPKPNDCDKHQGSNSESHRTRFSRCIRRRFEKCHPEFSCPASLRTAAGTTFAPEGAKNRSSIARRH